MKAYKPLLRKTVTYKNFKLIPIRYEDRYLIMKWRNEQIYHLRQNDPLTIKVQDAYFDNVISELFKQDKPKQILFSLLKDNKCIGYGGLVHINWVDKNAEISFIMDTKLEKINFKSYWKLFLKLLEIVAFQELKFHKIYTYAYELREQLFEVLKDCNYLQEAVLKEHVLINDYFVNALIHSKLNKTN
jgi:RimJ/RimL family protein N-acetyltransferase